MHKILLLSLSFITFTFSYSQQLPVTLSAAVKRLEVDPQMKHGILAFQVVESATGKLVFSNNSEMGVSVASTQKVFTAAAAFELLGKDFRYKTAMRLTEDAISNSITNASLIIDGSGDPTLGSWRYKGTTDSVILNQWVSVLKTMGIKEIRGGIKMVDQDDPSSVALTIPEGYIWQDIGNYYGAGTSLINWHENQYDVILKSGNTGNVVSVLNLLPDPGLKLINLLVAGTAGSGDNAYIFAGPYAKTGYIKGTIPPNEKKFLISGSFPDPAYALAVAVRIALEKNGITVDSLIQTSASLPSTGITQIQGIELPGSAHISPALDSIVYWFLKKSINLYGEALVKTFSKQENGHYQLDAGLEILRNFWLKQGIERSAFHVGDGSGLSPSNRVTVSSLVKVMQYAKSRSWFNSFYEALPEFNGIKMKSGTINGVKSFTGYIRNKANREFTFAIVVNNYDGNTAQIVQKMYNLLDILK